MTSPEPVAIISMVNIIRTITPPPRPRAIWAMYGVIKPEKWLKKTEKENV